MSTSMRVISGDIVRLMFDREVVIAEDMHDHWRITATNGPGKPPHVFRLSPINGVVICAQIDQQPLAPIADAT